MLRPRPFIGGMSGAPPGGGTGGQEWARGAAMNVVTNLELEDAVAPTCGDSRPLYPGGV